MEKESTGGHGRVLITLSNIFSSKYVEPESVSFILTARMYTIIDITMPCEYTFVFFYINFLNL